MIDVKDKVLGRIATNIAQLLRGKGKPYFVSHMDCGDSVVVLNAAHIVVTGSKETKKEYTRYSGYPGGQKRETVSHLRIRKPEDIIRHAVSGMLPKNKLRDQWLSKLHIFSQKEHPYHKQLDL